MSVKKNDPQYPNPYATGGHTQSLSVTTHGKKYRVRNDEPGGTVWGKNLDYVQAVKLKERIAGERKSKNPIIEDMAISVDSHPPTVAAAPAPVDPDRDAAVRAAFEAGRAQGQNEASTPPVIVSTSTTTAGTPATPSNGTTPHVELDPGDLADESLIDSELDIQ